MKFLTKSYTKLLKPYKCLLMEFSNCNYNMNLSQMLGVTSQHLFTNLITNLNKTTYQQKIAGLSKIADQITQIVTKSKTFQKPCKFGIMG